jgi:hypothetical protein
MRKKKPRSSQRQSRKLNGRANPHSAHRQQDKLTIHLPGLPELSLSLTGDERELYDSLKLPPKVQAFRALERRRTGAQLKIRDGNNKVSRLRQQLLGAWMERLQSEENLEFYRSYIAVLATDQKTDFHFPMDYADLKASQRRFEHFTTTACWWCGGEMGLSEFHEKRFYCCDACRVAADRRRDEIRKRPPGFSALPDRIPCPYCETKTELKRLSRMRENPNVHDALKRITSGKSRVGVTEV